MSNRLEVHEDKPGILRATLTYPFTHVDGELRLTVMWSDDDECWVARYEDAEAPPCIGIGDTQLDALAHFCGALRSQLNAWKTLYEDRP
jgi:hypothetical protein